MKSEAQKERGLTSRFHSFDPGSMRRSSKSHPRTEFTRTPSSLSMSRSQSSGRDPRMLDMMKARSVGSDQSSLSSQTSLHSNWMVPSLASSDVNTVGRYPIKWDHGLESLSLNRNEDDMSITSHSTLFSHPFSSSVSSGVTEGGKRKRCLNSEAISDSDDDVSCQTSPKRPRTPLPSSVPNKAELPFNFFYKIKTITKKLLVILLKAFLFLSLLVLVLLCYTGYKNYQCSQLRSQRLEIGEISLELGREIVGQSQAVHQIVTALRQFSLQSNDPEHRKLLLLPFTGWVGVGKTHTATILSHLLPCNHNLNFISCSLISMDLIRRIREKTALTCGYGLVVLDDCDLEDRMVEDFIKSLVIELEQTVESKSSGTILVITTSSGAKTVNRLAARHLKTGGSLAELSSSDLVAELEQDPSLSFISRLTSSSVISQTVPFLPLATSTVRECIRRLGRDQGLDLSPGQVGAVLDMQQVTVAGSTELVTTGCKQVVSKMDLVRGGAPVRDL